MATVSRDTWVAVGLETAAGTPAVVGNMRRLDADFTFPGLEVTKPLRDNATTAHGLPAVPALAATAGTLELTVPVDAASEVRATAADPISPPPYDVLLQCCGLERTDSAPDRTATYTLGGEATCTLEWRAGNRRFQMVGCRGTATLSADAGGDLTWTFSMMGRALVVHRATSAAVPAEVGRAYRRLRTLDASVELANVAQDGSVGSAVALDESLIGVGLDLGTQLSRPGDITAPDGNGLPIITASRPVQTLNMIAPDLTGTSMDAFWGLIVNDALLRVASTFLSPDADVSLQVVLGSASATSGEVSDADGLVSQQITASGVDVADEPLQLIFTTPAP